MKKNFETFKSGDVVKLKPDFPYIDHDLFHCDRYIVDKMLADAGVVTLKEFPYNRTFPDGAFELYGIGEYDRYYLNGDC